MADDLPRVEPETSAPDDGPTPAEVYGETFELREDPYFSLNHFDGLDEVKSDLRTKVVERLGMGRYSPASVLLYNNDTSAIVEYVGKGLTGECPDTWTTLQVDAIESTTKVECSSLEYVFEEATRRAPTIVVLDEVAEDMFREKTEGVSTFLEGVRDTEAKVLVVAMVSDANSDVLEFQDHFDVVVDVPAPDDAFREWYIVEQLRTAVDEGVVTVDESSWENSSSIQTQQLSLAHLETSARRTIQRIVAETDAECPTVSPGDVEDTIAIVKSELLEDGSGADPLEVEFGDEEFDPSVPSTTFDDVGGLDDEIRRLRAAVQKPVEYRDTFERAGFSVGQGILLHGPPGNGKTMLAKAVANELSYRFFSVKGPEMQDPFVGETERRIRDLFAAAREHGPSVVFFDEFDSLAPDRNDLDRAYKEDFVNALLAELDGMDPLEDVLVMAATNRLDELDDAVTRSGRFDTFIEVTPPDIDAVERIFAIHTDELPTTDAVTPEWFTSLSVEGISGADIATVCRKALEFAVRDFDSGTSTELTVRRHHVVEALEQTEADTPTDTDEPGFH
jgi:transitional endoplasmic reticulum ATPase